MEKLTQSILKGFSFSPHRHRTFKRKVAFKGFEPFYSEPSQFFHFYDLESKILEPLGVFVDFAARFLLLAESQKNPLGKSPAKSSKTYTTKIPDTHVCTLAGPTLLPISNPNRQQLDIARIGITMIPGVMAALVFLETAR